MLPYAGRIIAIGVVIAATLFLGCWLSDSGGLGARPFLRDAFSEAPEGDGGPELGEAGASPVPNAESGRDLTVPLWPEHIVLLEQTRLDREGVEGAIFTTESSRRQSVVDYYRALLRGRGWHELKSGEEVAAKAGLKAEGLYAFAGDGGTFFLGYDTDASTVHFVTMHLPRRSK